jgi:hypothetical protein
MATVYDLLPSPQRDNAMGDTSQAYQQHFRDTVNRFFPRTADPTRDATFVRLRFIQRLGLTVLNVPNQLPVTIPWANLTPEQQWKRYAAWVVQGRREDENPFQPGLGTVRASVGYAHIPVQQDCVVCGTANARACTGCNIPSVSFPTGMSTSSY